MMAFCKKHSTLILVVFLITMLVLSWSIPSERLFLGMVFVLFSFGIAGLAAIEKQREAYRRGRITRGVLVRNALLEVTGTGLAMLLAGLLGRYAAHAAAQQIHNDLLKLVAGILVGFVVGIVTGALAQKTWGRLVRVDATGRGEPLG